MSTTSTDPIADMLSRIRNAIAVRKTEVALPHSKVKESVAQLLKDSRFIDSVSVEDAPVGKTLKVVINQPTSNARITEIVRLSKPGRRYYSRAEKIPVVKRGRHRHCQYVQGHDDRPGSQKARCGRRINLQSLLTKLA